MPGDMARVLAVRWTSEKSEVVLEVPDESGKGLQDSDKCSWKQLFHEMLKSGVTDASINSHEVHAPMAAPVDQGQEPKSRMTFFSIVLWNPLG